MIIALYSPYLDTLGGGERYMMSIAAILAEGNKVDVLLDKHLLNLGIDLKNELSKRFNLNLREVNFIRAPLGKNSSALSRAIFLRKYDLLFYLTDGSIFYPTAGKNILHIQYPILGQPSKSILGKLKLKGWDKILYNSEFTKRHSENNWPLTSEVIYPPVDTQNFKPLKKEKYILSVGRFFGFLKDKKQGFLIRTFRELFESGEIKGWSLHLVGSAAEGDREYLEELKQAAVGLPIKFYPNLKYDKLQKLYGESAIYWHASGFRETDPSKMEHFGISTVEAMAAGAVPVVIGKGGQVEIVQQGKSGYLWETAEEFLEFTLKLVRDNTLREKLGKEAIIRAKDFSFDNFRKKITQLVKR